MARHFSVLIAGLALASVACGTDPSPVAARPGDIARILLAVRGGTADNKSIGMIDSTSRVPLEVTAFDARGNRVAFTERPVFFARDSSAIGVTSDGIVYPRRVGQSYVIAVLVRNGRPFTDSVFAVRVR